MTLGNNLRKLEKIETKADLAKKLIHWISIRDDEPIESAKARYEKRTGVVIDDSSLIIISQIGEIDDTKVVFDNPT